MCGNIYKKYNVVYTLNQIQIELDQRIILYALSFVSRLLCQTQYYNTSTLYCDPSLTGPSLAGLA